MLIVITSCNLRDVKDEIVDMPISEAKISSIEGIIFDTMEFNRTSNGLNYILGNSEKSGIKPDTSSHVLIEYKIFSSKGDLLIKVDTLDSDYQLYVKDCSKPLAESICLLHLNSTINIIIDGVSVRSLYENASENENYMAEITLKDFHQHFD